MAQAPARMLVYTKNGQGYVHQNIPAAVQALQQLGSSAGLAVDVSDDPAVFTEAGLQRYALLVFANTNNDVFDSDAERLAFRRYLEAGGGVVGIHSVLGTERRWPWFRMMLGGTFNWHAPFQAFSVRRIDRRHPSVQNLPDEWRTHDEFYFLKDMHPGIHVVLAGDVRTLGPDDSARVRQSAIPFNDLYPVAWSHDFDGGTVWVTTLGHDARDYQDPTFLSLLRGGLAWVAGRARPLEPRAAYATGRDAPVR